MPEKTPTTVPVSPSKPVATSQGNSNTQVQTPKSLPDFSKMNPQELQKGALKFVQVQQSSGQDMKQIVSTLSSWGITLNGDGTAKYEAPASQKEGALSDVGSDISGRFSKAGELSSEAMDSSKTSFGQGLEKEFQAGGQVAGTVGDIIGELFKGIDNTGFGKSMKEKYDAQIAANPELKSQEDAKSKFFGDVSQKVSDWSAQHPEAAANLGAVLNYATAATTAAGVEGVPEAVKGTASQAEALAKTAVGKIGEIPGPGEIIRKLTPTPSDVQGSIKSMVSSPEDAQAVSKLVTDAQTEAKAIKSNPRAAGPKQTLGDTYFGKTEDSIPAQISKALKDSGSAKSAIVDANASVPVEVTPKMAVDGEGNPVLGTNGKSLTSFDQYVKGQGIQEDLKEADQVKLYDFQNDLASLSKNPTLKQVDGMVDKWQESVYDNKSPSYIRDESLRNAVRNEIGNINGQLKKFVTEKVPGGEEYGNANTKYSQVIQTKGELMDQLGTLNSTTGRYSGADALLGHINDTEGSYKNLWDAIETHTPKIGNLSLTDRAVVKNFIHDIYAGKSVKSALSNVPTFGISPKSIAFRTAMKTAMGGLTNPDTVVKKLLDLIGQAGKE